MRSIVRFSTRILIPAFAIYAVLTVGSFGESEEGASAPAAATGSASTEAPTYDTSIYQIPAGDAAKKIAFMQDLLHSPPPANTQEAMDFHRKQIIAAVKQAAEQVMADPKAKEQQAARAAQQKLQMLQFAARSQMPGAAEEAKNFMVALRQNKKPAVRAVIEQYDLLDEFNQWQSLDKSQKERWLKDFVDNFRIVPHEVADISMLQQISGMLGIQGDEQIAAKLVKAAYEILSKDEVESVAKYSKYLGETVKFYDLIGTEMELEGRLASGGKLNWEDYRGKVVLVDFWATWCSACIQDLPTVQALHKAYAAKGFEVLGINMDINHDRLQQFLAQRPLDWENTVHDYEGDDPYDHPIANKYGVQALPSPILVGKDGKVISVSARGENLYRHLQRIFGEPDLSGLTGPGGSPASAGGAGE